MVAPSVFCQAKMGYLLTSENFLLIVARRIPRGEIRSAATWQDEENAKNR
jgi:hypothetical protein